MNARHQRRMWIILTILAGGLLAAQLVLLVGPASWAAPDHNPHRQTIPTPFTPTDWLYLPCVARLYTAGQAAPDLPLAAWGH